MKMYLVHARPSLAVQGSGLDVFWHKLASHNWDLRPAVQDLQGQVFIALHRLVCDMFTHHNLLFIFLKWTTDKTNHHDRVCSRSITS